MQRDVTALRRGLYRLRQHLRSQTLAACFKAWRCGSGDGLAALLRSPWRKEAQTAVAQMSWNLERRGQALKKACRADRDDYLGALADRAQQGHEAEAYRALSRLMGRVRKKPFAPAVLPTLRKADGTLCSTPEEVVQRWRSHFSTLEAGQPATPETLLASSQRKTPWKGPECVGDLPTLSELQITFACAPRGKSAGPDGIPNELGLACPQRLAELVYPLLLKLCVRGEEAVGLKGGTLVRLYKGRGAHDECGSHRAIMLLSTLAKAIHKVLRPKIADIFVKSTSKLQLGGKPGCSVVFGSHVVRTFLRWRAMAGQSCAVVFADIASAYYAAVRQLAVGHDDADSSIGLHAAIEGLKLSHDEAVALRQHAQEVCALHRSGAPSWTQPGAPSWTQELAHELHSSTWFNMAGDTELVATHRGTRPGSSWADVLFGCLLHRVLSHRNASARRETADDSIDAHANVPLVPWDGVHTLEPVVTPTQHLPLDDVVWADDLAMCLQSDSADSIGVKVSAAVSRLDEAFSEHGLTLTYGERKTAAMVCPKGKRSREVRRALFGEKQSVLVLRESRGPVSLPLVAQYPYLGVCQAPCGAMQGELHRRVGAAWGAFREGRRRVYKSRRLSVSRKGQILHSLVMSKLLHGAGSWPPLNHKEMQTFGGTVFSLYRAILCIPHGGEQHVSLSDAVARTELPSPVTLIHAERLRYLAQLVTSGPDVLWALLRADRPYADAMKESLDWLTRALRNTCAELQGGASWDIWTGIMRDTPRRFRGLIKRALALDICRHQCIEALDGLHRAMREMANKGEPVANASFESCAEACVPCKLAFPTRVAWAGHAARKHGYRNSSFLLAECRTCRGCGRTYGSIGRLRRHLQSVSRCQELWGSFAPTDPDPQTAPHPQCPPGTSLGTFVQVDVDNRAVIDSVHGMHSPFLLRSLQDVGAADWEALWEEVVGCIEPLPVLRATVRLRMDQLGPLSPEYGTLERILLSLTPAVRWPCLG